MIWKYPQDFKKVSYKPGEMSEYVGGDVILDCWPSSGPTLP